MTAIWQTPPAAFHLAEGVAHVWRLRLDAPHLNAALFRPLLNSEECARADRYRFDLNRNQFTSARGVLRTLLARYTGAEKTAIEFQFSTHGKPALDPNSCDHPITFNVSHSGAMALIGFTIKNAIGVDVEEIERTVSEEKIADRYFSPDEVARLNGLPNHDQSAGFFRCWTRKEAFIKAHGDGLSLPLDSFSVTFGEGEPPQLVRFDREPGPSGWNLAAPDMGDGYVGAACVASPATEYRFFEYAE